MLFANRSGLKTLTPWVAVAGLAAILVCAPSTDAQITPSLPNLQPNYIGTAITLRHWHQPEVLFHIDPTGETRRTPEQLTALVTQGVSLWQDKIGSKLLIRPTDNAADADVDITFVPNGSLKEGRVGATDVDFTEPENDIQHASIHICAGLPVAAITQCAAHEFGHALGIQGHSDNKGDLMYAYIHVPAAVSDRDANTLIADYALVDTSKKPREFKRGQKFGHVRSY